MCHTLYLLYLTLYVTSSSFILYIEYVCVYTYTIYLFISYRVFATCRPCQYLCMLHASLVQIRNQQWCSQRSIRFLNQLDPIELVGTGWIMMNPMPCVSLTFCFFAKHFPFLVICFYLCWRWDFEDSASCGSCDAAPWWPWRTIWAEQQNVSMHDGSATFCLFTTSYFRFGG